MKKDTTSIIIIILLMCAIIGLTIAGHIISNTPKPTPKQHQVLWIITDKTTVDSRTINIGLQDDGAIIWRYGIDF